MESDGSKTADDLSGDPTGCDVTLGIVQKRKAVRVESVVIACTLGTQFSQRVDAPIVHDFRPRRLVLHRVHQHGLRQNVHGGRDEGRRDKRERLHHILSLNNENIQIYSAAVQLQTCKGVQGTKIFLNLIQKKFHKKQNFAITFKIENFIQKMEFRV